MPIKRRQIKSGRFQSRINEHLLNAIERVKSLERGFLSKGQIADRALYDFCKKYNDERELLKKGRDPLIDVLLKKVDI